jgi:hypothetical protein
MALLTAVLASNKTEAQTAPATTDASVITQAFVQSQALKQGDGESLKKAEAKFTPEGLSEFTKKMDGFIDDKGAPTFSQEFVPKGDAVIVGQKNGVLIVRISGELKQTHDTSVTTYPGTFEVNATNTPPQITHFSLLVGTPK